MLKTLHAYLLKDLVKVTLLTLVALTLLMSVLAIIQPLRKLGLAGEQVLELFIYTIPIMLSLTLPVATLFATTLVYGRFSQDNELLAARASGISTLSLLRPALGLGGAVTLISLAMINVVAPKLSTLSGLVESNIRQIIFHDLKTRGYFSHAMGNQRFVIHADAVNPDEGAMFGAVMVVEKLEAPKKPASVPKGTKAKKAEKKKPADGAKPKSAGVTMAWATWATVRFVRDPNGEDKVLILAKDPYIATTIGVKRPAATGKLFPLPELRMLDPIRQKISWYSWSDLLETLKNPVLYSPVQRELTKIRQSLCSDMLAAQIVAAIQNGKSFKGFVRGDEEFEIEAAWAVQDKNAAKLSSLQPSGKKGKLVSVVVRRAGKVVEIVTARRGEVVSALSRQTGEPQVTIELDTEVTDNSLGPTLPGISRPNDKMFGGLAIPTEVLTKANAVGLPDLYDNPQRLTKDPKVMASINYLKNRRIPKLRSSLIAEMHVRMAYGASCFLMVAMGAALGLLFRGGQFISAFALSTVPAAGVIIMLLMGKAIVSNPASSNIVGLCCIWGGIVMLLAANLVIYARLARR